MRVVPDTVVSQINQSYKAEPTAPKVAAESVTTEAKAPQDESMSSRLAEMARKEKIFRSRVQQRESALVAREEALKAREADYQSNYIPKTKIQEMFQTDPYKALEEFKISGDLVTQGLLNQPGPQDKLIRELREELAAVKAGQEKISQSIEETSTNAYKEAVGQILMDVNGLVKNNPDFEMINHRGAQQDVVDLIEHVFKNGWPEKQMAAKYLLSNEEAAKIVEDFLTEGSVKDAQLKKVQEKLKALSSEASLKDQEIKAKAPPKTPTTLANAVAPSTSKPMSRVERAIAAYEGRLQQ